MIDLADVLKQMAARSPSRTEADLQADVRTLLLHGDLSLDDQDLEVALESPAGGGRRIDVETGSTVIEVKKDLRVGRVRTVAVAQLAGYLRQRTQYMDRRYVGVLTDGCEWRLYTLDIDDEPAEVSTLLVDPAEPDVEKLKTWLEGVLATRSKIRPTPDEIRARLGAGTSSFALDASTLTSLYQFCRLDREVQVRRMLWARLLTTAFGDNFRDDDKLFLEHTYLVVVAKIVAHVIAGFDVTNEDPRSLLAGSLFTRADIAGVVDADFFDWVGSTDGGVKFLRELARRITRFDWFDVEHDVLKVLYESIVSPEERHALGEYYTPDWLAQRIVDEIIGSPLQERILDPACGSGTFLFYAVRKFLEAADNEKLSTHDSLTRLTSYVYGFDVHPVAVTLARVTYLMAIGFSRLQDRGPLVIPVYLGDSLQWGQDEDLYTQGALVVRTTDDGDLGASDLRFPASVAGDIEPLDSLVTDLTIRATSRSPGERPLPSINTILDRHHIEGVDRAIIEATFASLCRLHDDGWNHIWSYYVRNLARPYWLSVDANRPDILLGNPPWLSYRYMTSSMKIRFRRESEERGLWAGSNVATSQDLSGYFVARVIQLYLRTGGRFAFIMPNAVLSRPHFAGFRTGSWSANAENTRVQFAQPWDIHLVRPHVFPMPASVVFGQRKLNAKEMGDHSVVWSGSLTGENLQWAQAAPYLQTRDAKIVRPGDTQSPYRRRFRQGATIAPRGLMTVELLPMGPLGVSKGKCRVRSIKSSQEKAPWKSLAVVQGSVEERFVMNLHLGATLVPFRWLDPLKTVIPWTGSRLLGQFDGALDEYPGLAAWWRTVASLWNEHNNDASLDLKGRIDYHRLLTVQFSSGPHRIAYNTSGTRLVAAYVDDPNAIIDTTLYWCETRSREEADYLCAIINSTLMTELVNPLQSKGNFGPRHFHLLPFQFPIPTYDPANSLHAELATLGATSAWIAMSVELPDNVSCKKARKLIGSALTENRLGGNELVRSLLLE